MTDFMVAEIKFNTNEPTFYPVRVNDMDLFIVRKGEDGGLSLLQLTVESDETYVGLPFYEFHQLDGEIQEVITQDLFPMEEYFRPIGYERWILKKDERFVGDIKTSKTSL